MNFVLIFLITIFSLSLFFYGRSKTKSISIEKNIKLNALPKFYGYYLVLWCSIPSLVFLLIWTLFEPVIIKSIIIETAANQGAIFNDKNEANLIYEKIKANIELNKINFIDKPYTRFKGTEFEQNTFFVEDPNGNVLELKTFEQ